MVSYGYSYGYGAYGNYLGRSEDYSDVVARIAAVVARDEEGNFIAKDGNKLTPEEAANTLFGE